MRWTLIDGVISSVTKVWYTGHNDYRKLTVDEGSTNTFTMELRDVETVTYNTVQEAYTEHLKSALLPVEVLYSGGLDSESAIVGCLQNNIPVVAVSMRLLFRGNPINVHDLYYSEKFCRNHGVKQYHFDLNLDSFFGNGDHTKYMEPYNLFEPNTPTQMWLVEQCHSFPIIGGDYTWPQEKLYSPHRYEFAMFDVFMREQSIPGIGNMISHSLESNMFFIKEHLSLRKKHSINGDYLAIGQFKLQLLENLGFGKLEARHRSDGWEFVKRSNLWLDTIQPVINSSVTKYKNTKSIIKWNMSLGNLLEIGPGSNDNYGMTNLIGLLRRKTL